MHEVASDPARACMTYTDTAMWEIAAVFLLVSAVPDGAAPIAPYMVHLGGAPDAPWVDLVYDTFARADTAHGYLCGTGYTPAWADDCTLRVPLPRHDPHAGASGRAWILAPLGGALAARVARRRRAAATRKE